MDPGKAFRPPFFGGGGPRGGLVHIFETYMSETSHTQNLVEIKKCKNKTRKNKSQTKFPSVRYLNEIMMKLPQNRIKSKESERTFI